MDEDRRTKELGSWEKPAGPTLLLLDPPASRCLHWECLQ